MRRAPVNNVYDFTDMHFPSAALRFPEKTVATLPSATDAANLGIVYVVTDGQNASDCTIGGGSTRVLCTANGVAWVALGGGGGGSGDMLVATYDPATVAEQLVGLTATQTLTNKTLTSPAIATPTGIVKGDVGLGNVDNTSDATKNSATATLTNKRVTPRVVTLTDAATVTMNADTTDMGILATLSQATLFANPSGTPTDGQRLNLRIKSTSIRALTWDTQFRAGTDLTPLLAATSGGGLTDYLGFIWNSADSKWDFTSLAGGF